MRTATTLLGVLLSACCPAAGAQPVAVRAMTYNLEDVRTADLLTPDQPRVRRLAEVIQRLRPNILLLNEIAYDEPGGPDVPADARPGSNAARFVDLYLAVPQADGLRPLSYQVFTAPSNTGRASGFDLNRDGRIVTTYPDPPPGAPDGAPGPQTDEGRAYGDDAWGFGTFPGQYAMALLVDPRLEILEDRVRTFRLLPWSYLPDHLMPIVPPDQRDKADTAPDPDTPIDDAWYAGEAGDLFRLSSKSFWDIPVRLPNGEVLHVLCSHPTPPAFDGPEERNKRRNHDEIRLIADYIDGAAYLVDDAGRGGGLRSDDRFLVLGDLNADPDEGGAIYNPVRRLLLDSPRIADYDPPNSPIAIEGLDPDDTARFGLRVDYVLFSEGISSARSGVWRGLEGDDRPPPSDHFPVWADLIVPDKNGSEP
ncbi:MAG: endonuclease/exonuclease/phosphatase family protein [Phycisphaerales bacterium JB040]